MRPEEEIRALLDSARILRKMQRITRTEQPETRNLVATLEWVLGDAPHLGETVS